VNVLGDYEHSRHVLYDYSQLNAKSNKTKIYCVDEDSKKKNSIDELRNYDENPNESEKSNARCSREARGEQSASENMRTRRSYSNFKVAWM
jgi:vancomycin resistance protein YoaR